MARKGRKLTDEEEAAFEARVKEFDELLERRKAVDEKLAAERQEREQEQRRS
jgi:hypothetical protein